MFIEFDRKLINLDHVVHIEQALIPSGKESSGYFSLTVLTTTHKYYSEYFEDKDSLEKRLECLKIELNASMTQSDTRKIANEIYLLRMALAE